jgi:hypothetical protein
MNHLPPVFQIHYFSLWIWICGFLIMNDRSCPGFQSIMNLVFLYISVAFEEKSCKMGRISSVPIAGSGVFSIPGSGIAFSGSQTHNFESLVTIFWVILSELAEIFFFACFKIKLSIVTLYLRKRQDTVFLSPPIFCCRWIRDLRSRIKNKSQNTRSG